MILCMQNSVLSIRITSLNGSQSSSVVFAFNTATLKPELQVCLGPSPHQWFGALKIVYLASEFQVCMGPTPRLWICECKTACLVPE